MVTPLVPWIADGEAGNAAITKRPLKYILTQSGMDVDTTGFTGLVTAYNPVAFGADATGLVPADSSFADCLAACSVGGIIHVPSGTYSFANALTITKNLTLRGVGLGTVLLFTGATDGVVITDVGNPYPNVSVRDLDIRTSNAAGGKALSYNTPTHGAGRSVSSNNTLSTSGSGRWAYGFFGDNCQSASVHSLRIATSATVAIRLQNFCNALKFYDTEIVGGAAGDATFHRGIEIDSTYDPAFFGGTVQGFFSQSCMRLSNGSNPSLFYIHFENTNATPSDGADVVATNSSQGLAFVGCKGFSLDIGMDVSACRAVGVFGGELGAIRFGAAAQSCMLAGVRCFSITDNGAQNSFVGCSQSSGGPFANKLTSVFATDGVPVHPGGVQIAGIGVVNSAGFYSLDAGGVARSLMFVSPANQTYHQYLGQLNIRDTAGTQRATITSSGANTTLDLAGAAAKLTVGGTQVLTARQAAVATPNAQTAAYVQADVTSLKTAIDAIRAVLIAHGLTA